MPTYTVRPLGETAWSENIRTGHRDEGMTSPANPRPADIRALRESAGLSRPEFAALVHASKRGLEKWEKGERKMHPGLWELAQIKLGICG